MSTETIAEDSITDGSSPETTVLNAVVSDDEAGLRVDRVAALLFPEYSRSRLKGWIEDGRLTLNGERIKRARDLVEVDDELEVHPVARPETGSVPQDIPINILYEDEHIVVVNKDSGLTVHPGAGQSAGTLQNALLFHYPECVNVPRAGIVHRLDKDTSGAMVIAKTVLAHTALVQTIQNRDVTRTYETIVNGRITAGSTVNEPIGRDPSHRTRMAVVHGARESVTHFRISERFAFHTQLTVTLETGRTHQIRVHMRHIRHPIVGDTLYGGGIIRGPGMDSDLRSALAAFPRQALHARSLEFDHPVTGERISCEAPIPDDMQQIIAMLRRLSPDTGD